MIFGVLTFLIQLLFWQLVSAFSITQTTVTSYVYHYDSNGNLTQTDKNEMAQYHYGYNSLNQLVFATDAVNDKTYTYQYYADGHRAAKVDEVNGQSVDFYYGQNGKLLNEALTIDQVQTKISSYFAGSRFIKDLQNTNNSQLTESLGIRHNHPASIALKNGITQTTSYHIDDYGQLIDSNDDTQSTTDNGFDFEQNPYIFGAGYHDFETGLNYQGARYYNPNAQRFIAQDSFDLINRYNYADGNPVMSYDPSGHNAIGEFFGSSAGNYILNGVGIAVSAASIAVAPELTMPLIIGEAAGIGSGGLGIVAQGLSDGHIGSKKVAQGLNTASMALGIMSFAVGVGDLGFAGYKQYQRVANNTRWIEEDVELDTIPSNWQEVKSNGESFTNGAFGEVYLYKNKFYKRGIVERYLAEPNANVYQNYVLNPHRAAAFWNYYFSQAYDGQGMVYATATVRKLLNGEKEIEVLVTPNLRAFSVKRSVISDEMLSAFSEEMSKLSMYIGDAHTDNVVVINNRIFPIDYDLAYMTETTGQSNGLLIQGNSGVKEISDSLQTQVISRY